MSLPLRTLGGDHALVPTTTQLIDRLLALDLAGLGGKLNASCEMELEGDQPP